MKELKYAVIIFLTFISCKAQEETPTAFSETAMQDVFVTLKGDDITFKSILETHKGKTILIDVWASWCGDCLRGMPKVKKLQEDYKDIAYVFLSLDKTQKAWKKGIKKHSVNGNHYFIKSGWKGAFGEFVNLDWIPRYIVVNPNGTIKLFKAVEATDKRITEIFNN